MEQLMLGQNACLWQTSDKLTVTDPAHNSPEVMPLLERIVSCLRAIGSQGYDELEEAIQRTKPSVHNEQMDKQNTVYPYNGIHFSHKKEGSTVTC